MNVTVEELAPCKKLLRVEVDAKEVDATFETVTKEFLRHGSLPGFRPGKAPRDLVVRTYGPKIQDEVRRKLLPDAYKRAMEEQKMRAVVSPDIEEVQFGQGQALQFTATVEIEPTFELPDYKGLAVKRENRIVTDEDLAKAMDVLRDQRVTYLDVTRPVQKGDYVVVNYEGTCEGKPISEMTDGAKGLGGQKNYWMAIETDFFLPGFTDHLVGAQAGEKRQVTATFPAGFVVPELVGKQGTYDVEIIQVKEKLAPEVNDEFAHSLGAKSVEDLRTGVRNDLENDLKLKLRRQVRDQLVGLLLGRVSCDLPDALVQYETRNVVYDIVRTNQERGVTKEAIDQRKDEIYSVANNSARDRVKATLIFRRIAEKESISVNEKEILQRVSAMAQQNQVKPEKMLKQLEERGSLVQIHQQILAGKVLDFLELHALIEEVAPGS